MHSLNSKIIEIYAYTSFDELQGYLSCLPSWFSPDLLLGVVSHGKLFIT